MTPEEIQQLEEILYSTTTGEFRNGNLPAQSVLDQMQAALGDVTIAPIGSPEWVAQMENTDFDSVVADSEAITNNRQDSGSDLFFTNQVQNDTLNDRYGTEFTTGGWSDDGLTYDVGGVDEATLRDNALKWASENNIPLVSEDGKIYSFGDNLVNMAVWRDQLNDDQWKELSGRGEGYITPVDTSMTPLQIAGIVGGAMLGGPLASAFGGGVAGAAASGATINAGQQLLTTGDLDFDKVAQSALTGGAGAALGGVAADIAGSQAAAAGTEFVADAAEQSGVLGQIMDVLGTGYDVYQNSQNMDEMQDDRPPDIAWQVPDVSDVLGDVQVQVPDYQQPQDNEESGGGGGGGGGEPIPDNTTPEVGGDGTYVYQGDGIWKDMRDGDLIYGPGSDGQVMTDDEMAEAWESGDYSWDEAATDAPEDTDMDSTTPPNEAPDGFEWVLVNNDWVLEPTNDELSTGDLPGAPSTTPGVDNGEGTGNDGNGDGSDGSGDGSVGDGSGNNGTGDGTDGTGQGDGGDGNGDGDGEGDGEDAGTITNTYAQQGGKADDTEQDDDPLVLYDWVNRFHDAEQERSFGRVSDRVTGDSRSAIINLLKKRGYDDAAVQRALADMDADALAIDGDTSL